MTAGASSPPWRSSVAVRAFVDSASPGKNDVDSLFSASANLVGSCAGPTAMKIPISQIRKTTHLDRRPVATVKMERREFMCATVASGRRLRQGHDRAAGRGRPADDQRIDR